MTEFHVTLKEPLLVPDDLTVPQFLLDSTHPKRAIRPSGAPWLIQEETGRQVHLEELRERVAGVANTLALDYGLQDNQVACVFTPNHIDFPVVVWALHRLGLTASCANPSYTSSELVHCLKASKSQFIFVHPPSLPIALEAAKQAGIPAKNIVLFNVPGLKYPKGYATVEDLVVNGLTRPQGYVEVRLAPGEAKTKVAFLSFSSGTTGKPKAIAISHYSPIANVIQTCVHVGVAHKPKSDRFTPGDVALGVLPFFHIYGLVVSIHFVLFAGQSLVVSPKFSFVGMCESIKKYRISVLFLVPPQVVLMCKHPAAKNYDWSQIKVLMSGAAPLTHAINEQIVKLLTNAAIGQGYGMTETATSICWPPYTVKHAPFGSAGQLMPGVTVRIVKEDGSLAKVGEKGEIFIHSISNALGYVDAPEANAETFVDGWVRTGDEGSIDENNWVYVHDRLKELIKVRGFQVAPAELEGHILSHTDVRDTCVVSILDDYSGELPLAFIALSEDAAKRAKGSPAEAAKIKASVAKHVADHMINYKHLHGGVEIIDEIPKNPSGKLLRRVLREKARAMPTAASVKAKL